MTSAGENDDGGIAAHARCWRACPVNASRDLAKSFPSQSDRE